MSKIDFRKTNLFFILTPWKTVNESNELYFSYLFDAPV